MEEWKEKSRPVLIRIFELEIKAEDLGMTDAERLEYEILQEQWSEWIGVSGNISLRGLNQDE